MELELDSDCEETDEESKTRVDNSNSFSGSRVFSGELSPGSGPGAGLEYDLWEGQFQFVEHCPTRDRIPRQNHPGGGALDEQVHMIQEQMHALADTQSVGEERYARAKEENATLQARILMLEESTKDAESRAEERLQAEQRRHREFACRLERERQLQIENYSIKLQAVELESASLRDEVSRLREQLDKVRAEKNRLENSLDDARREAESAHELERQALSRSNEANHMLEAAREELASRVEDQQKLEELIQEVSHLRARNKSLEESRDELQAAAALQAGRELLMLNPCASKIEKGSSLAAELLAGMNQDQPDGSSPRDPEPRTLSEMKQALKEQQEVNTQLRAYIDGILLNIVENYPQLLEVKQAN